MPTWRTGIRNRLNCRHICAHLVSFPVLTLSLSRPTRISLSQAASALVYQRWQVPSLIPSDQEGYQINSYHDFVPVTCHSVTVPAPLERGGLQPQFLQIGAMHQSLSVEQGLLWAFRRLFFYAGAIGHNGFVPRAMSGGAFTHCRDVPCTPITCPRNGSPNFRSYNLRLLNGMRVVLVVS